MSFYTITSEQLTNAIADAIVGREAEIFSYEMNITNYEIMLTTLPTDDWPNHLVQYQYVTLDRVPDEYDATVSEYQYRDRLRLLLKTERLERSKSVKIYEALLSRLPEETKADLIAAAHTRYLALTSQ